MTVPINANLAVFISDTHTSMSGSPTATGEISITETLQIANHINSLKPYLVFDLGDWGDHFGSLADYQQYKTYLHDVIRRLYAFTRGNHDEDQDIGAGTSTAFTVVDSVFPGKPYRGHFDWPAPKIRFIVFHATIIHDGGLQGFFSVTSEELDLLDAELAAVPADYKIIIGGHPPRLGDFGNNIRDETGGSDLDAVLAPYAPRTLAYLNGHRHQTCNTGVDSNGILHINGSSVSKTTGTDNGGFMLFVYNPNTQQIKMHFREATSISVPRCDFGPSGATAYTPITISL